MNAGQLYKIKIRYVHSVHFTYDHIHNSFMKLNWALDAFKSNVVPGSGLDDNNPFGLPINGGGGNGGNGGRGSNGGGGSSSTTTTSTTTITTTIGGNGGTGGTGGSIEDQWYDHLITTIVSFLIFRPRT
jgi:hypothetical protein